jgi:hypothetical protein
MLQTRKLVLVRLGIVALAASVMPIICGCSGTGTVSGVVTCDGEKLQYGTVLFMTEGGARSSEIASDGTYVMRDVPPGLARISISCVDPKFMNTGINDSNAAKKEKKKPPLGTSFSAEEYSKIPLRYNNPDSSELTLEVKGGNQTFDLILKK